MPESKLWHNKTGPKNVKVAKMVEIIKTCDQYPRKFNFGHFFSYIILPPFSWRKFRFSKNAVWEKRVTFICLEDDDKNLAEIFAWWYE